jgi:HEAT repeat protein
VAVRVLELRDRDWRVRRHAAWALGELESPRGVRPLLECLEDESAEVRHVSAWALGEIKHHLAIRPLIERLHDHDPLVREMAVLALGELGHPSAVAPLMEALQQHGALLEPVYRALGKIKGEQAHSLRHTLEQELGLRQQDDEIFIGGLVMVRARQVAPSLPSLAAAVRSDDPSLRRLAAEWLGLQGNERAVDLLLGALRDPEPSVRTVAIWALDEINPSRPDLALLVPLLCIIVAVIGDAFLLRAPELRTTHT